MGSFIESFNQGLNLGHTLENDKRMRAAAQQQAQLFQMQMMKLARDLAVQPKMSDYQLYEKLGPEEYSKFKGAGRAEPKSPTTAMEAYLNDPNTDKSPEAVAEYKRSLSAPPKPNLTDANIDAIAEGITTDPSGEITQAEAQRLRKIRSKGTKDSSQYGKGWNESIGKLQNIRKARLRLESGMSEFGVEFKMTPSIKSSIDQYKGMEKRQESFIKKRFPKEAADYFPKETTKRKPGETISQYLERTGG